VAQEPHAVSAHESEHVRSWLHEEFMNGARHAATPPGLVNCWRQSKQPGEDRRSAARPDWHAVVVCAPWHALAAAARSLSEQL
jgi:hypothetical protein